MPLFNIRSFYRFLDKMLKPLGDPEYQRRAWVEHKEGVVDDYDEAIMDFLDRCEEVCNDLDYYEGVDSIIQKSLKELYFHRLQKNILLGMP